jgi:hypothetical protein
MLILRGRSYWFGNQDKEAAEYFKKAIALQPDYALGWAGLSDYYGKAAVDGELTPGRLTRKRNSRQGRRCNSMTRFRMRIFPWLGVSEALRLELCGRGIGSVRRAQSGFCCCTPLSGLDARPTEPHGRGSS